MKQLTGSPTSHSTHPGNTKLAYHDQHPHDSEQVGVRELRPRDERVVLRKRRNQLSMKGKQYTHKGSNRQTTDLKHELHSVHSVCEAFHDC